jgi:hypothetical protein
LIVLSKTHVWGRYMRPGRTKDPEHAHTCALFFDVFSGASSKLLWGSRTDPSIHDVILPITRLSQR